VQTLLVLMILEKMIKNCSKCCFLQFSLSGNKIYKCKQFGNIKRFNNAKLHGLFCKRFKKEKPNE